MRLDDQLFKLSTMVGASLILVSCGDVGSETATMGEPHSTPAKPTFSIGDPVNFDAFEIVVKKVEEEQQVGSEFIRESAADGGTYVVVSYTVKNTGKKPIGMFDGPSLQLVDESGTTYDPDIAASAAFASGADLNSKTLSDLNPGITVKDADVWEVSASDFDRATWRIIVAGHEDSPIKLN